MVKAILHYIKETGIPALVIEISHHISPVFYKFLEKKHLRNFFKLCHRLSFLTFTDRLIPQATLFPNREQSGLPAFYSTDYPLLAL
jgi:hypothetical protein